MARGDHLEAAVAAALDEAEARQVRRRVSQTVWDPSSNEVAKTSGLLAFMPFKSGGDAALDHDVLHHVFSLLPFHCLRSLALVCKRWRSVATGETLTRRPQDNSETLPRHFETLSAHFRRYLIPLHRRPPPSTDASTTRPCTDPSWKPDVVVYAWGSPDVSGIAGGSSVPRLLPFSRMHEVRSLTCADNATLALGMDGSVWHWGRSWLPHGDAVPEPVRIPELSGVAALSATPPGYDHERSQRRGFSAAAVTHGGHLWVFGTSFSVEGVAAGVAAEECRQLLQRERLVVRPRRVLRFGGAPAASAAVAQVAVGLRFLAVATRPLAAEGLAASSASPPATASTASPADDPTASAPERRSSQVFTVGVFCEPGDAHALRAWEGLAGVPLRQLCAGSFHCCALSTSGELYTWGHPLGRDVSNGNLLGHGPIPLPAEHAPLAQPPRRVAGLAQHPVAEVSCSTYSVLALTTDGRAFTWGDSDGDALGHDEDECSAPRWLDAPSLRGQNLAHGAVAYTNAAVATTDGRVFMWGGNAWERGIAAGRAARGPSEITWSGAPPCYQCTSVSLAWRHGYLLFHKRA